MATKVVCANCKKAWLAKAGYYEDPKQHGKTERLRLTGRRDGSKREYVCLDCGHTGWTTSKSKQLQKG